jgi:hypothetical protein
MLESLMDLQTGFILLTQPQEIAINENPTIPLASFERFCSGNNSTEANSENQFANS